MKCATVESIMVWYFCKGLKSFVRAKIEQHGQELNNFKKLMQKAIDIEAKAAFWLHSYVCNTNWYCF